MKKSLVRIVLFCLLIGLVACSSNKNAEQSPTNTDSNDNSTQNTSTVTWEDFKENWANAMPIDELKNMEELEADEGIKVPNVKRYNMKISNYLFLGVNVDETTDEILYITLLGKYHEDIFKNQVEGFKTMTSLLNPKLDEVSIDQIIIYNLNLNPEMNGNLSSRSIEQNGYKYDTSYKDGIVQLEITLP